MSKHLSLSERSIIESMLNKDFTFAQIAKKLGRTGSTISREVHKRRIFTGKFDNYTHNDCIYFFSCLKNTVCPKHPTHGCFTRCKLCSEADCTKLCDRYVSCNCELLNKPPYVCTGCPKQKSCKKEHAYYTATKAHADYLSELKKARSGIRTSKEELLRINDIIAPLIMRGQSINHILVTHKDEIGLSEKTIYNYIDSCAFHVRNIDLPKKVAYRQRRQKHVFTSMDYKYRKGRSYEDFKAYTSEHPDEEVVEMDTVKGARGSGKVLLTLIFRKSNFMLIFLMPDGTQESVLTVFDILYDKLGAKVFRSLFKVILTDNGVEFKNPLGIEYALNGCRRTRVFFCDPQASWQKPHVEKNHVFIRRILPKGTSFNNLSAKDILLVCRHINSVPREIFGNKSPFDLFTGKQKEKLLDHLNLAPIPTDEVILNPKLLKK